MVRKFFCIALVMVLAACSHQQKQALDGQTVVAVDPTPAIVNPVPAQIDTAAIFSNPNVTIFPLDGSISAHESRLNQYRGVLNNTTAGGYTVFDESVTVYAIDNTMGMTRPSYLPEYSVPKYAAQYQSDRIREQFTEENIIPPLPMGVSHNAVTITPAAPMMDQGAALRRSPPVLTAYE